MPNIFESVKNGNVEEVQNIVPEEVNKTNENGDTLLHIATTMGHTKCVEILLKKGANPTQENAMGNKPIDIAAMAGNAELLHLFLEGGIHVDVKDHGGWPLINLVCVSKDLNSLKVLLARAVNANATDRFGNTALHIAANHNFIEGAQLLLQYGVKCNCQNNFGETARHYAQQAEHYSLTSLLDNHLRDTQLKNDTYTGLVYEGGGVKGIGHMGATKKLIQTQAIDFAMVKVVAGTSAGSICAYLLALGYQIQEIEKIMYDLDFAELLDEPHKAQFLETKQKIDQEGISSIIGPELVELIQQLLNGEMSFSDLKIKLGIQGSINFISKLGVLTSMTQTIGLHDGKIIKIIDKFNDLRERYKNIFNEIIADKGIFSGEKIRFKLREWLFNKTGRKTLNFEELKSLTKQDSRFKELAVFSFNLDRQMIETFSADDRSHWQTDVVDAVYNSMAIPFIFKPLAKNSNFMVDGGLTNNYPISLVRQKYPHINWLGFRLVSPELYEHYVNGKPKPRTNTGDLLSYLMSMGLAFVNGQEIQHGAGPDHPRTVYINNNGIGPVDFNMSPVKKEQLVKSGEEGAVQFLNKKIPVKRKEAAVSLVNDESDEKSTLKKHRLHSATQRATTTVCVPQLPLSEPRQSLQLTESNHSATLFGNNLAKNDNFSKSNRPFNLPTQDEIQINYLIEITKPNKSYDVFCEDSANDDNFLVELANDAQLDDLDNGEEKNVYQPMLNRI